MMPRIALFNDTGKSAHVGCRAVSSGLNRMARRAGVLIKHRSFVNQWRGLAAKKFTSSDLPAIFKRMDGVVVNGEGTIHHTGGGHLITILRGAQRMRRPTHLINAVLQDCDQHLDVLQRLTTCTVRDLASSAYLTRVGVKHRVVFDAVAEADFLDRPSDLDLSGKIVVTDVHGSRLDVIAALIRVRERYGTTAVYYPLNDRKRATRWQHTIADWKRARAVITGRHHGVCLAAMAGIPFVALGSNTWKVEGLLSLLPGGQTVASPHADLVRACEQAMAKPQAFAAMQRWIERQCPLKTFDAIREAA